MKLAISTLPCKEWSLEKTLQLCNKNDITGLELRTGLNDWSQIDLSQPECDYILEMLTKHKIRITDLATSVVVSGYDEYQLLEYERCVQLAKRLHTKGIRIMLGYFRERWSQNIAEVDIEGMSYWLRQADKIAGKNEVELWIETHNEYATGEALQRLFQDNRLPNSKVIWDVMHPIEQNENFVKTYDTLKEYLVHVHIKDGLPWADADMASWKYTKLGDGIVPIREIVHLLEDSGYSGYYSLEWESLWRNEIRGEDYTGEIVIPHYSKFMKELS
jgi:sugar phosphate isomerase/epimerase